MPSPVSPVSNRPTTPPANNPPPANDAVLTVRLDAGCDGKVGMVDASVDGVFIGKATAGASGVSIRTYLGSHSIYGKSANGYTFGPFTEQLEANGLIFVFTCR